MAGLEGEGNKPSEHGSIKVTMKVLEDFPDRDKRQDIVGLLKKGEERTIEIADGETKNFGNFEGCDCVIPLEELDEIQF